MEGSNKVEELKDRLEQQEEAVDLTTDIRLADTYFKEKKKGEKES